MYPINQINSKLSSTLNKINLQKNAFNILVNGKKQKKDCLEVSPEARKFSKEAILAMVDENANVSAGELLFYLKNYNNSKAILDAINFGTAVEAGYNPLFKDYGTISFLSEGMGRQSIPIYAVPKINKNLLGKPYAKDNKLILNNKSYYCYTGNSGKQYTWTINNGHIGWAQSESLLSETNNKSEAKSDWEMLKTRGVLTQLAQGKKSNAFTKTETLAALNSVGIAEGYFEINAGAGTHKYILREDGGIYDVKKKVDFFSNYNWLKQGYQKGDTFKIFGNKYKINENGHIDISENDTFTSSEIEYPVRTDSIANQF